MNTSERKTLLEALERECQADQDFAQQVARLAPKWFAGKVQWWGVALFGGSKEHNKKGQWVREGGKWNQPFHGQDPAFLSREDAEAYAEKEHGFKAAWSKERGLEVPYQVVPMGHSPGERPITH